MYDKTLGNLWDSRKDWKKTKRARSQEPNDGMINHVKSSRLSEMNTENWLLDVTNDDPDISAAVELGD